MSLGILIAACAALTAAGFLGVDRWFYEAVSLRLNAPANLPSDWYQRTKLFWNVCRLWPHVIGVGLCYFGVAALAQRGFRDANRLLIQVVGVALLANGLQAAIGRARPNQAESPLIFREFSIRGLLGGGVGFPSGEVATAFALSASLGFLFPRWSAPFYVPAVLVLLARWLPGMHYLSDVAAGALLGVVLPRGLNRRARNSSPRGRMG